MNVTLIGPDNVEAVVGISESATVRDVATYKYHLFGGSPREMTPLSLPLRQKLSMETPSP